MTKNPTYLPRLCVTAENKYVINDHSKRYFELISVLFMKIFELQAEQGSVDLNVTLQLLLSLNSDISDINGAEQSADHVIRLIAAVFRLHEVVRIAIGYVAVLQLSPKLCGSLFRFLRGWSFKYLLLRDPGYLRSSYSAPSLTIYKAFGLEALGCHWFFDFFIQITACHIEAFKVEPIVINEIMGVLTSLSKDYNK